MTAAKEPGLYRSRRQLTDDELEYVRKAQVRHQTTQEVAASLHCQVRTIQKWFRRFRLYGSDAARASQVTLPRDDAHFNVSRGPMCRHGSCQKIGSGKPPFCKEHQPKAAAPTVVLPWEITAQRKMAGR